MSITKFRTGREVLPADSVTENNFENDSIAIYCKDNEERDNKFAADVIDPSEDKVTKGHQPGIVVYSTSVSSGMSKEELEKKTDLVIANFQRLVNDYVDEVRTISSLGHDIISPLNSFDQTSENRCSSFDQETQVHQNDNSISSLNFDQMNQQNNLKHNNAIVGSYFDQCEEDLFSFGDLPSQSSTQNSNQTDDITLLSSSFDHMQHSHRNPVDEKQNFSGNPFDQFVVNSQKSNHVQLTHRFVPSITINHKNSQQNGVNLSQNQDPYAIWDSL